MTKLILIGGTMGVGKTATCEQLRLHLNRSVWLDGDWCWMMNPWMITEENKRMVEDNIAYLLRNFLANPSFDYVIFSWVMHRQEIIDLILNRLNDLPYELCNISLVCSSESLRRRMQNGGRNAEAIEASIARLSMYADLDTLKVDSTDKTVSVVVDSVVRVCGLSSS